MLEPLSRTPVLRRCKSAWHLHRTQASPACPRCAETWKTIKRGKKKARQGDPKRDELERTEAELAQQRKPRRTALRQAGFRDRPEDLGPNAS